MKFKHWKEAEKREKEVSEELKNLNEEISNKEEEARTEEIEVEKRELLISEITTCVEKRDKMQEELKQITKEKEELKGEEERQIGLLDNLSKNKIEKREERKMETKNIDSTEEYRNAWIDSVRAGDREIVTRFLNTEGENDGKALVPTELSNEIHDKLMQGGKILNLCNVSMIAGILEEVSISEKTDPEVHKETGAEKKKKKSIKSLITKLDPEYIAEILETTRKFESLSREAFWNWLKRELPDALLRKIDGLILTSTQEEGNGIKGIMTDTALVAVIKKELSFNSVNEAIAELEDGVEDNINVAMNRKTFFNTIMGLKDTTGQPIFKIASNNEGKPLYFVSGQPVKFDSRIKSYDEAQTGDKYMVVGNFKGYSVNFPNGLEPEITRDAVTRKDENIVEYLSEILAAGSVVKKGYFTVIEKV